MRCVNLFEDEQIQELQRTARGVVLLEPKGSGGHDFVEDQNGNAAEGHEARVDVFDVVVVLLHVPPVDDHEDVGEHVEAMDCEAHVDAAHLPRQLEPQLHKHHLRDAVALLGRLVVILEVEFDRCFFTALPSFVCVVADCCLGRAEEN